MVYIPLHHHPTHSKTPTLNHPRSPRSILLQFSSSSWTLARFSVLNQSLFFFFYTSKIGLHNTTVTVVDFGPKDRATKVIAPYEITCSCCWIKIAKIHAYKQKVSSIEAGFS